MTQDPTGLRSFVWRPRYSTSRQDLVESFYRPAMERSSRYDRAVGYFRSSFYSVAGGVTAAFAARGGKIRILCAPDLTTDDASAIGRGLAMRDAVNEALQRELDRILAFPLSRPSVELLAALVATDSLDFRFAVRSDSVGIFHDKVGIFHDAEGDGISFSGSVNETWQGWHPLGNHESFEVFVSWSRDAERVGDHAVYFEDLWHGRADRLDVFEAPRAFRERLLRLAPPGELSRYVNVPPGDVPVPTALLDHQRDAVANWVEAGRRGIFQHATGSGKTLTSLHAIRDWIAAGRPALVLVPSTLLLKQWRETAARELAVLDPSILMAGGGHESWRRDGLLRLHTASVNGPRLTIATVQTASSDSFLNQVEGGQHLLLVGDEVHRLGSPRFRRVLSIPSGAALGLSATPHRYGDAEGSGVIRRYFGDIVPPIIELRDAINFGRLVPYEYHVHVVDLDADEIREYDEFSAKIGKMFGVAGEPTSSGGYLDHLLIQRARIIKHARQKAPLAAEIVAQQAKRGSGWLVYCESQYQVRDVLVRLRDAGLEAYEYHTAMGGNPEATLSRFRHFGGILVAIRCLDEGVDLPEVSHAVILASSRNRREFIQRRGRVLRASLGKNRAVVHDLMVSPPPSGREGAYDALARGELARAREFAKDADNAGTGKFLERLCIEWGIEIDEANTEFGEDDVGEED